MGNGFYSRSLHAQDAPNNPDPPRMQRPLPPPKRQKLPYDGGRTSMRERMARLRAWVAMRGKRRLLKDSLLLGVGFGAVYSIFLWLTLPDISNTKNLIPIHSSVIVDHNGVELYRLYDEENRTAIPDKDIPQYVKHAIVAIEDERFYDRGCLDVQALARVFFRFGHAGGASTLTRQLARNALNLQKENIINRKLKELILGCQLEARYDKDAILSLYLNWIPFGQNAYGIELASRTYFDAGAKNLTIAQAVVLAALPQRPSYFSPYGKHVHTEVSDDVLQKIAAGTITNASQIPDEEVTIGLLGANVGTGTSVVYIGGRTDQVLKNMETLGFIKKEEKVTALADLQKIEFKPNRENIRAPHFVLWVKNQVEALLSGGAEEGMLNQGGLTIETTLDWNMQQAAEALIAQKMPSITETYGAHNTALVSVETGTNRILAYVGNADYNDEEHDGKVDMARAARQPGSSINPFVYATAFEKGYSPSTVLFDVATKIGDDAPQNFDGGFWGLMNVRRALGASRNIPAIKMYFAAGEENSILEFVSRMGVVSPLEQKRTFVEQNPDFEYGWPLALGAGETPLIEMVQGYATFANGGVYKPLIAIERIKNRNGSIVYEADTDNEGSQAMDPRIAYEITSVLSDASVRPNDYWKNVLTVPGFQTAAKTGTSNKCLKRDDKGNCTDRKPDNLWTMGFTPNIVTGMWMGNANAEALSPKAESLNLVSPIWKEFMIKAHKQLINPKTSFEMPSGMVQMQISALSGELPTECTPVAYRTSDVFIQDKVPSEPDPACVRLLVDKVTGLLASPECPAEAAEERSFFQPQEILATRFPQWQQSVIECAGKASFSGGTLPLPLAPTKSCTIALTPGRLEKPEVQIDYPDDGEGASYPAFKPRISVSVGSRIREIRILIDGKQVLRTNNTHDLAVQAPRSVKESGRHTLTVTIEDEYYNTATDETAFTFEKDNDAPSVRFTSPRGDIDAHAGETLVLQVDAEDNQGGLRYVQFYIDNTLLTTKPNEPYRLEWPADLEPGTYRLRAVATDLAGNEGEDEIELKIEN